jgi:hypothetical protein
MFHFDNLRLVSRSAPAASAVRQRNRQLRPAYSAGLLMFAWILCWGIPTQARDFRPDQLPNGSVYLCGNCHIPLGRSGPLNSFGELVASGFLDRRGDVVWGPELANLDADGDGITNGEELGDPQGAWRVGDPSPGNPAAVTKAWDALSPPPDLSSLVAQQSWGLVKSSGKQLIRMRFELQVGR